MDNELDRRSFVLGFVVSALGAAAGGAAAAPISSEPWAVWDSKDKPVRGGIYRVAAEQYIGKMNPNHWPVLDWISMGYFHEKLLLTDGQYKSTVPWLAEEVKFEDPQTVLMRLREGVRFHDGSKLDAEAI